ncbi:MULTISPECIES: DNA polymerase IV [unclassified Gilliamella]|uniref:DNA polymerase IV n=1 Tax=unclassified Gilliamella TaxID=2685620 RepID=UPI00130C5ED5|nr:MULTISPECIES: DNA polymerase IV [unclassified Gilliamella]MWP49889.1 DNA polymerase IV [Gilliamella sp. Lep-s35]MWP68525.1 DNA polymerase IV [Gilliamella sp. Lep-s5]MWP77940.1 DNA polymerase IV [Gilliamella sp. Lep-s21]
MRKIIHVDMDCFYAAVEMRDNPRYRNIPIAVGGDPRKRGVVATANYLARQYGIHSAMSMAQAVKLCPNLKIIPGRHAVYKEVSKQIHQIFKRYTESIEALSLDEAYLDVTDCKRCYGSATFIAQDIRQAIFNELELTASAGVAPLKFLAKVASDMNKPNGQYVITPDEVDSFIEKLSLKKIPGVGKVTEKKLAQLGLFTCNDVVNYDVTKLIKQFGKFGRVLYERCQGIDDRKVCNDRQRKSVGVERTLTDDIHSWEECLLQFDPLFDEMEKRLSKVRADLSIARQGVKFKFDDFQLTTQEHAWSKLDKADLIEQAHKVWVERRNGRGVRLIGFHVTLIDPQVEKQLIFLF